MTIENTEFGAAESPESQAGAKRTPKPRPRKIKLHDVDHIRLEMARVYRESRLGVIEVAAGSRLINMLSLIARTYEMSVLEERMKALESADAQSA